MTSLTGVARITGATIAGTNPYSIRFADSASASSRYLALTKSQRLTPTPQQIERVTYPTSPYTPSSLTVPGFGADYILIAHPDFWAEAQVLAQHRARLTVWRL